VWNFDPGIVITLGAFVFVLLIIAIRTLGHVRERELQAHQELQSRQMEHERRMKELEVEKARLELEKAKTNQPR
jgi:hypothetical protein